MLNKTIIQGRFTRDAELRETQAGTKVASFTVAWSEKYKDTERKLFMPCVAWGNNAEFACTWFSKGSEVVVEGYLTSRKWQDKIGNSRETIELTVDRLHFCGPKQTGSGAPVTDTFSLDGLPEGFTAADSDGDLPF
jgi:single-strand DNA-binding protein